MAVLALAVASAQAADPPFDHYTCWRVRDPAKLAATVDLDTLRAGLEVEPGCVIRGRAELYCTPSRKAVVALTSSLAPIEMPGQDLQDDRVCYKLKCPKGAAIPPQDVEDQFGRRTVERFSVRMLCTNARVAAAVTSTTTTSSTTSTTLAPGDPGLWTLADLDYRGAFRLPAADYGASSLNFSEGPIAYDPAHHSLFIVGHDHHQAVAEFAIPALVETTTLTSLNMAGAPRQPFATVLGRAPIGDDVNLLNQIGGLLVVTGPGGPQLLVNAYEYYDAPGDNWLTTMVVRDATNLAGSTVDGFVAFEGGAGHTSGWMSPIPPAWQAALGGTHLTGQSSGIPIISRTSVGPSAFAFDPGDLMGPGALPDPIQTTKLLDYSLTHPLHADLSNDSRTNALWTHLSRATYGLVVPGTRTYLVVGASGGHVSGVGYKITQDDGTVCGGYCAYAAADNYTYYWAYDLDDLIAVRQGTLASWAVLPYEVGQLPVPFPTREIGGGAFDAASGTLYLTLQRADTAQGVYANPPVVAAYGLGS